MINYVEQFIDNAFWQETLLLALRALPHTQTLKVLEHILNRDPKGIERYFYHNHYFMMKFIAEQGKWLDRRDFVERQINDFFDFSWNNGKRSLNDNRTWDRFNKWVSTVTDSLVQSILSSKLLSIAGDEKQSGFIRSHCVYTVGNLGRNDQVVEILLRLAEGEKQAGSLRGYCAEAVGKLGRKDQAVVERLLRLAKDEKQEGDLRRYCAASIGELGEKHKAVDILIELYLAQPDKYDFDAGEIYNSLWDLTAV